MVHSLLRSRPGRGAAVAAAAALALLASVLAVPTSVLAADAPERIGGADRYEVSALISQETFDSAVAVAYVASGAVFADALSASAVAGSRQAPVLLVSATGIPPAIATELTRLKPARIVVVGGEATVTAETLKALEAFSPIVGRVAGTDRYEVSARISGSVFAPARPVVFVASGAVFPDALSGSAAAGALGGPVLLTTKDSIPPVVLTELNRLTPERIVVMGGEATVSETVVKALAEIAPTSRRAGADRYEVSARAAAGFVTGLDTVYVASGAVFPDALSGSAAAILDKAPVLLVQQGGIPDSVADELARLSPQNIVVLGGTATVGDEVLTELASFLPGPM
ncbi:cell wall-binding repeat-containing protein [Herbiconiux sp. P15]|uniref:cell wall-binding repeat-containing protein n=1 Tax=Herbiconiux liukaitaii TaxID=3342799 RepID=UPI0035B6F88D